MNNLRQVRKVIYILKKQYGVRVNIIVPNTINQDIQTGTIVADESSIIIRKAIILTSRIIRDFTYDLSFIASNKNFTYGGFFDQSQRIMIIDIKDIPKTYEPAIGHRCIYNNKNYDFKEYNSIAERQGFLVKLQNVESSDTENVEEIKISEVITLKEDAPWLI